MGSHLRLLEKENTMKIALPLALVAGLGSAGPQFYGYRPLPYTAYSPVQGRKFSGNVNLGPGASITWGARGSLTDNIVPTGTTGNYAGKQAAKVVVQASAESALAYMRAFLDKDDLCGASGLAYMESILSGTNSPCVKATLAYASKSPLASSANSDAMIAFINQAVEDGVGADPVCAAATIAFLDAKIAKKSDKEAGAASAEAYIEAFAANGGKRSEACKKSAEAYIKTF